MLRWFAFYVYANTRVLRCYPVYPLGLRLLRLFVNVTFYTTRGCYRFRVCYARYGHAFCCLPLFTFWLHVADCIVRLVAFTLRFVPFLRYVCRCWLLITVVGYYCARSFTFGLIAAVCVCTLILLPVTHHVTIAAFC